MVDIAKISMERIDNLDVTIADINADISSVETTILQNISTQIASLNAKITSIETTISQMTYIVETWHEGTEWYRIWSDGWIEQGGQINGNVVEVEFHKPFSDLNYNVQALYMDATSTEAIWIYNISAFNRSTTKMTLRNASSTIFRRSWYACGY